MQNVSNGSQRFVREARSPEPVQLDDWENEGGSPPVITDDERAAFFVRLAKSLSGAPGQIADSVRTRPLATLGAVFALGLAVGGGLRHLRSGRLLMAVAAKPLFAIATGVLLKK